MGRQPTDQEIPVEGRPHACWGACGKVVQGHNKWRQHVLEAHTDKQAPPVFCGQKCPGMSQPPLEPARRGDLARDYASIFGGDD